MTPKTHKHLDWVVAEGLHVPTHPLDRCGPCHTWANHVHSSMHESRDHFEAALTEATLGIQADMARVYEACLEAAHVEIQSDAARIYNKRLEAARIEIQSDAARVYDERLEAATLGLQREIALTYEGRLEEVNVLNGLISEQLAGKTNEVRWCQATNKRLTNRLDASLVWVDDLEAELRRVKNKEQALRDKLQIVWNVIEPETVPSAEAVASGHATRQLEAINISSSEDESVPGQRLPAASRSLPKYRMRAFSQRATRLHGGAPYAHTMNPQPQHKKLGCARTKSTN
ncbi:hypothetical protein BDV93DRAFT_567202 [Ceratobasidium sp. AG-I]|nr:hypothetical protein BDV93DRAFT_567202 [Ceratobasidium sp. AG-I]